MPDIDFIAGFLLWGRIPSMGGLKTETGLMAGFFIYQIIFRRTK